MATQGGKAALISLRGIGRHYQSGESTIRALDGVDIEISAGEFVAIMGQSGSGKSTLMNILGCLDKPTLGTYLIDGKDVADFEGDRLAELRRETFGFVFQRYNLLATASAAENVEIPAIYAGMDKAARSGRAAQLLTKLGLGTRLVNRPSQLSGGQQQRVAIARALMNNPPVILADEPTGALDSASGKEVMQLLKDLHAEGRTVILITHDAGVAAHAQRQIKIQDGKVLEDTGSVKAARALEPVKSKTSKDSTLPEVGEAIQTALRSLKVNMFRTALTLLGIVIGVASVVTMLAVGNGSSEKVVSQISAMGTNMLSVRPGAPGVRSSGDNATLMVADGDAVAAMENIRVVVPERSGKYTMRYGRNDYSSSVSGVNEGLPITRDWAMAKGSFFTARDVSSYAPVIVLGQTVAANLFGPLTDPIGEKVLVKNVPFEVVGVLATKGASIMGSDQDDVAYIPITTGLVRLFGGNYVSGLNVMVNDVNQIDATQAAVSEMIKSRHRGVEDFQIRNTASLLEMVSETQGTLTILLGTVAAISLLVGGIGVMNIMLVSVTERTREIGVRMAVGARRGDILVQFITEAVVVGILGGVIGVLLGIGLGLIIGAFGVNIVFTAGPPLMAFGCAFMTGLVFGYVPARKAAGLDPVVALSSE